MRLLAGWFLLALGVWCSGAVETPPTATALPDVPPRVATAFDTRPGFRVIDSIVQLREALLASGQKIRMKPGTYFVEDCLADGQTVFHATGSNNHFDLRGVILQVDTAVLAQMKAKAAHDLATYRIDGNHQTFEGAVFEDVGEKPPAISLPEFEIAGDGNVFKDCTFTIRGSAPYGYGRLFGKGKGRGEFKPTLGERLRKHSAMSIRGDNTQVLGCKFFIRTFGHAISIHGAQDTLVEDTYIEGTLRPTAEILQETSGPAFDQKFIDMFHRPIPSGQMLALAEDGIRAYNNGEKNGQTRRTGAITVLHCTVKRMRGAISLSLASKPARVEDCTVVEAGWTGAGYNVPSDSSVKNCKGDAAFSPLLNQDRSNKRGADISIEVLDAPESCAGHPLAILNGTDHHVTLTHRSAKPLPVSLKILVGAAGDDASPGDEDGENRKAAEVFGKGLRLNNQTPQAVLLTAQSSACVVNSAGPPTDHGRGNQVSGAQRGSDQ